MMNLTYQEMKEMIRNHEDKLRVHVMSEVGTTNARFNSFHVVDSEHGFCVVDDKRKSVEIPEAAERIAFFNNYKDGKCYIYIRNHKTEITIVA